MLPGGLDVIGLFAVGSPDMMQSAQAKLRQASADTVVDYIVTQFHCRFSQKYKCYINSENWNLFMNAG